MKQQTKKNLVFFLLGNTAPETWTLPQRSVLVENNETGFKQNIIYVPGAQSIWKHELEKQGDILKNAKKEDITFVHGTLSVSADNKLLIDYLKTHPWFGVKFSLVDKSADAQKVIDKTDLITKAVLNLQGKELDMITVGLLVFGESALLQNEKELEALVKQKAITDPKSIVDAYSEEGEWKFKKVVALALSKGVIKINPTKTAVLWTSTNETIITLAVGQKPIDETALFLSQSKNQTTLQALSLKLESKDVISTQKDKNNIELSTNVEVLQKQYEDKFGAIPPINKKNDVEWLSKKLLEVNS